jgi:[acyl-carrier-protein] S-malonyltransferase
LARHVLALLCPGQGAQTPGMLSPWLELPAVAERLRWAAAVTGLDVIRLGTTADADEIRDTAIAQPLLVALALALGPELVEEPGVSLVTGHSVGEYAAAALAGALSPEAALVLVRERGRLMAAAAASHPTGMSAVLGGEPDAVDAALARHGLTAANVNGAGQIVAGGLRVALEALADDPPEGARVRPLPVAGAFHTAFMAPARDGLAAVAAAAPRHDPRLRLLGNRDGAILSNGDDVVRRLIEQVAQPVRWDACMRTMTDLGVSAAVELAPAGTLAGLAKRALPGVEVVALKSPDDLRTARALIQRHGAVAMTEPAPSWRVAVAPVAGVFRRLAVSPGDHVGEGHSVGRIEARRSEAVVTAAHGGILVEWLADDGDPVSPGQPVARLHPNPEGSLLLDEPVTA